MHHQNSWTRFFFGTPRRAVITLVVIAILVLTGLLKYLLYRLEEELLIPLLGLAVVLFALRIALGGHRRGEKK